MMPLGLRGTPRPRVCPSPENCATPVAPARRPDAVEDRLGLGTVLPSVLTASTPHPNPTPARERRKVGEGVCSRQLSILAAFLRATKDPAHAMAVFPPSRTPDVSFRVQVNRSRPRRFLSDPVSSMATSRAFIALAAELTRCLFSTFKNTRTVSVGRPTAGRGLAPQLWTAHPRGPP